MPRTSTIPRALRRSLRAAAVIVWAAAAGAGLSCGSTAPSSGQPVTTQVIDASGGQASVSGGRFKIQIPQGALTQSVVITIHQIAAPGTGAVGPVYEVGPTGTSFARPATLSFSFADLDLGAADPATLHVATFTGGQWVPVTSAVDNVSGFVTGQIPHLSPWGLIVDTAADPPDTDASLEPDAGADVVQGETDGAAGTDGAALETNEDTGGAAGVTGAAGGGAGTTGAGGGGGTTGAGGGAGSTGAGGGAGAGGAAGDSGAAGSSGAAGDSGQGGAGGQAADASADAPGGDDGADAPAVDPDAL